MADQSFMRSALSEPDGTGSAARVCTFLVVVFSLVWVTYLVLRQHAIPDLTNLTVWMTTTTGSLYGLNKVATMIGNRKGPANE